MNREQLEHMGTGKGFIAALDQSGGSTPKALKLYGLDESSYANDAEMFDRIHEMRSRIITSPAFNGDRILGAILFDMTMERQIDGIGTADSDGDGKKEFTIRIIPVVADDQTAPAFVALPAPEQIAPVVPVTSTSDGGGCNASRLCACNDVSMCGPARFVQELGEF